MANTFTGTFAFKESYPFRYHSGSWRRATGSDGIAHDLRTRGHIIVGAGGPYRDTSLFGITTNLKNEVWSPSQWMAEMPIGNYPSGISSLVVTLKQNYEDNKGAAWASSPKYVKDFRIIKVGSNFEIYDGSSKIATVSNNSGSHMLHQISATRGQRLNSGLKFIGDEIRLITYSTTSHGSAYLADQLVAKEIVFSSTGTQEQAEFLAVTNSVANNQFDNAPHLTSISIPQATTIGDNAFKGSPLTNVYIPQATTIGDNAFKSIINSSSTTVYMDESLNTGANKDRIFGISNWGNIKFLTTELSITQTQIDNAFHIVHNFGDGFGTIALNGTSIPNVWLTTKDSLLHVKNGDEITVNADVKPPHYTSGKTIWKYIVTGIKKTEIHSEIKPVLRIVKWNFITNKFESLGEIERYISYTFKLNHNEASTGVIEIDPEESQAHAFLHTLNSSTWDSKKEDIFIYNLNDEDGYEFFKIEKTELSNEQDQKKIIISGNNTFFMSDRIAFPALRGAGKKKKMEVTDKSSKIAKLILQTNGAKYTDGADTTSFTKGVDASNIANRIYPYLEILSAEEDMFPDFTLKYGYESVKSLFDKLFKKTLNGYRIKFNTIENKIQLIWSPLRDNTSLEVSQEFANENGYKVIIDGARKTDFAYNLKNNQESSVESSTALSAGRYKEKMISGGKSASATSISNSLTQELVKTNDYIITDINIIPLTHANLSDEMRLGDIITIKIEEEIVTIVKEAQIKQILKISSDDSYKIIPIADDTAQTGLSLLSERIRELKELADDEQM